MSKNKNGPYVWMDESGAIYALDDTSYLFKKNQGVRNLLMGNDGIEPYFHNNDEYLKFIDALYGEENASINIIREYVERDLYFSIPWEDRKNYREKYGENWYDKVKNDFDKVFEKILNEMLFSKIIDIIFDKVKNDIKTGRLNINKFDANAYIKQLH